MRCEDEQIRRFVHPVELDNYVVLFRELRTQGWAVNCSTLTKIRVAQPAPATPGSDVLRDDPRSARLGRLRSSFSYVGEDGRKGSNWAFVMATNRYPAIYVEFVRRADVATFI